MNENQEQAVIAIANVLDGMPNDEALEVCVSSCIGILLADLEAFDPNSSEFATIEDEVNAVLQKHHDRLKANEN